MANFPDGILNKHDEGELRMALGIESGRLIINFGKNISWIGLDRASLDSLIAMLQEYAAKEEIK